MSRSRVSKWTSVVDQSARVCPDATSPGASRRSPHKQSAVCRSLDSSEAAEGCGRILIEFVYDTVERSRRRSLREMWLAARESGTGRRTWPSVSGSSTTSRRGRPQSDALAAGRRAAASSTPSGRTNCSKIVVAWTRRAGSRGNTARLLGSYPDHPGMLLARGFSEACG